MKYFYRVFIILLFLNLAINCFLFESSLTTPDNKTFLRYLIKVVFIEFSRYQTKSPTD